MTHKGPDLKVLLLLKRAFTMNLCECAFIPLKQKGYKILHLKGIIKYKPVGTKEQENVVVFFIILHYKNGQNQNCSSFMNFKSSHERAY